MDLYESSGEGGRSGSGRSGSGRSGVCGIMEGWK